MATTTLAAPPDAEQPDAPKRSLGSLARRAAGFNWLGGLAGWIWLAIVIVPIYWIVITSLKTQSNYFASNPLVPPKDPTLDNFRMVLDNDFSHYFINSVIVVLGADIP